MEDGQIPKRECPTSEHYSAKSLSLILFTESGKRRTQRQSLRYLAEIRTANKPAV
jgi:hypothetical protein